MAFVRVATLNNFNCTKKEWKQLDKMVAEHPEHTFFVNSNARTPRLISINDHPYKAVVTVNPDLEPNPKLTDKVLQINSERVAFVRVKWLPERPDIEDLIDLMKSKGFHVVITAQRFNNKKSLLEYTSLEHYKHSCNRYRLAGNAWNKLVSFARSHKVDICDEKQLGCQGCGLCAIHTGGTAEDKIISVNSSTSGICPYNCPDCYAKTMQKFCVACGNSPIEFDHIKANHKQAGNTKHIKEARKAA